MPFPYVYVKNQANLTILNKKLIKSEYLTLQYNATFDVCTDDKSKNLPTCFPIAKFKIYKDFFIFSTFSKREN